LKWAKECGGHPSDLLLGKATRGATCGNASPPIRLKEQEKRVSRTGSQDLHALAFNAICVTAGYCGGGRAKKSV